MVSRYYKIRKLFHFLKSLLIEEYTLDETPWLWFAYYEDIINSHWTNRMFLFVPGG